MHLTSGISRLALPVVILLFSLPGPIAAQSQGGTAAPFAIRIGTCISAQPGEQQSIPVTKISGSQPIGGFDFRISYEPAVLTFDSSRPSAVFDIPGEFEWEYFTFRSEASTGMIRTVALAETNNGPHQPLQQTLPDSTVLFYLDFTATNDSSQLCTAHPIRFNWEDCADNMIAYYDDSADLATGFSRRVYDFNDVDITDYAAGLPTIFGCPDSCIDGIVDPNGNLRYVDYMNGYIALICLEPDVIRGDINLNAVPYEIADAIVFAGYFIWGPQAFIMNVEAQAASTDINGDGIILTLTDFVYLTRIIEGELMPIPSPPAAMAANPLGLIELVETDSSVVLRAQFDDSVGAMNLNLSCPCFSAPEDFAFRLLPDADHMDIAYDTSDGGLNILIYKLRPQENHDTIPATIPAGVSNIFEIVFTGQKPILNYCAAVGYYGRKFNTIIAEIPNFPPVFEPYPIQLINDCQGGLKYDFDANDPNTPADAVEYHIISGPGQIDINTGEWIYWPLCLDTGTTMTLQICASDSIHPCPQADSSLHAIIDLRIEMLPPILGDANGNQYINILDVSHVINYLFKGGPAPQPAIIVADADSDGVVSIFDVIYLIRYLYRGGPRPTCNHVGY